jgi:hypothetical protein
MADVSYRFAGIPDGVEASVEDVNDPGVEVATVTGTQSGYGDVDLPVGDYVAIYRSGGYEHRAAGDLAARVDSDYAGSGEVAYDNTMSGLTATDVQGALDELTARVVALETP